MKKITLLILGFAFLFISKGSCSNIDTVFVSVYGNPSNPQQFAETGYSINGQVWEYNVCGINPSIHIAIIDSVSCQPFNNCNKDLGQYNIFNDPDGDCIYGPGTFSNCRPRPENIFIYHDNDSTAIQRMAQVIDSVDNGHIIIAYSVWPYAYTSMDPAFKNIFQSLGSTLIPTMPDTVPFIFICRKGDAGSVHEIVGTQSNSLITMNMTYQCSATGISELNDVLYNLYPNPVKEKLHIDFQNADFKNGEIKIYDALGNLVSTQKHLDGDVIVNTEKFSPGVYFVRLESADRCSAVRFCKPK